MKRLVLILAIAGTLLASCSDDDSTDADAGTTSSSTTVDDTSTSAPATDGGDTDCSDAEIVGSSADFFANEQDPSQVPSIIGLADVDGDGQDELWAQTGAGASTTIIGLARRDGCTLTRVTFASGAPVELPVGGTIGTASGVACEASIDDEADLTTYALISTDGESYELTATEYALEGATLVEKAERSSGASTGDPSLGRYSGFTCGDLVAG